jgi:signal transduction histidine kinase
MGVGIAPDKAQLLFEAYTRGDNVGNVSGVGLGLSVVNKIVLLHGGRLTYSANPAGQGSVFCLFFPIE